MRTGSQRTQGNHIPAQDVWATTRNVKTIQCGDCVLSEPRILSLCRFSFRDLRERATREHTQLQMQGRLVKSAWISSTWIHDL